MSLADREQLRKQRNDAPPQEPPQSPNYWMWAAIVFLILAVLRYFWKPG